MSCVPSELPGSVINTGVALAGGHTRGLWAPRSQRKWGADTPASPRHPGMRHASSRGVGCSKPLDAPKKHQTQPRIKGKAKRRCGGEVGNKQGQRRPFRGFEDWFEGMLEGHLPQTSPTCRFPPSLPCGGKRFYPKNSFSAGGADSRRCHRSGPGSSSASAFPAASQHLANSLGPACKRPRLLPKHPFS